MTDYRRNRVPGGTYFFTVNLYDRSSELRINPAKRGLVARVAEGPYSSFHKAVVMGLYPVDWSGAGGLTISEIGEPSNGDFRDAGSDG